jgi:hypothetical protein
MSEEKRKAFEPTALGSLDAMPGIIRESIGIPADALSPILQMLIAKEFWFILMTDQKGMALQLSGAYPGWDRPRAWPAGRAR